MSQSKRHSLLETTTNTTAGFFGSYLITYGCFHLSDNIPTATLYATLGCTVWSLLRGYYLRRAFNHLHTKQRVVVAEVKEPETPFCHHLFVEEFNRLDYVYMLTCCKCGLSKTPEALPPALLDTARRQQRIIPATHPKHEYYKGLVEALQRTH